MTIYIFSQHASNDQCIVYQSKVELPDEGHDLMIIREFMHYHPGPDCRYLGNGLWDCGVTDQH